MSTQVPPLFMLMHKGSRKPKKNLGVLEIKPCQGRGLRVVQKIGKQDPYIQIEHGVRSQRTKADKNGGQKPRWEDNFKFDIFEGDTIVRVQCLDQNLRDSSLIGQRTIDFAPVLRSYQWDGWFGLTSQGECAGDVYLEFTYYPGPDIPKPVNPPKPAVHRVTLTPAEILNQMKESEDALPPLQHKDSNESPTDAEKGPCKKIIESPKSESSVDTIRDELSSMKLDANISTTSLPNIQRGNSPKIHPQASPHHYEKLPHHAQMNHTHSIAHRNSEPIIYPNGHFYPHSEMGSSESLSSPYMMSPPSQIPRMGGVHSSGRLPSKPASLGGPGSPHLTVDRRRSKLIGPRRANSTPQEHLRESSQLPRRDTPSPSPSQVILSVHMSNR
ncbi:hypothetical protein K7432_004571 [Basidiobolus ranarum]|uniref:C2 domain-containing protein n=1 Tax=Basidiobolus ranarum TaxID=34480 RepID=A0ABR2WXW6_9FUNG